MANAAEKENTFRKLNEQPLLATRWLCKFGWHRWTKYGELRKERRGVYDCLVQYRGCDCCGKIQQNVVNKA